MTDWLTGNVCALLSESLSKMVATKLANWNEMKMTMEKKYEKKFRQKKSKVKENL